MGEKRFREQKGKEHIKPDRSQEWDLIPSGFSKSPQDTNPRFFFHTVWEGPAARCTTSTPQLPKEWLCLSSVFPPQRATMRCTQSMVWAPQSCSTTAGKALLKDQKEVLVNFLTKQPYLGDTTPQHKQSSRIGNLCPMDGIIPSSSPVNLFMAQ